MSNGLHCVKAKIMSNGHIMSEVENRALSDKFMLRLPDGMRERIKVAAETNNRSMNSEIVAALEEKFPPPRSIVEVVKQQVLLDLLAAAPEDREEHVRLANRALIQAGSPDRFIIEGGGVRLVRG